jgi:hypothetical protein
MSKELGCVLPKQTLFPSILLILSYPPKPTLGAHQAKTRLLPLNPVCVCFFFFNFVMLPHWQSSTGRFSHLAVDQL